MDQWMWIFPDTWQAHLSEGMTARVWGNEEVKLAAKAAKLLASKQPGLSYDSGSVTLPAKLVSSNWTLLLLSLQIAIR